MVTPQISIFILKLLDPKIYMAQTFLKLLENVLDQMLS